MNAGAPSGQIILTREQVRRLDVLAATELGIPTLLLMENAAISLARVALEMLPEGGDFEPQVGILCGPGNNGGDGFALARHLVSAGVDVIVAATAPRQRYAGDALVNLQIIERMGVPIDHLWERDPAGNLTELFHCDGVEPWDTIGLIVDGLLGTGSTSPVREPVSSVVRWINRQRRAEGVPVLAIDIPTGLDADTGAPLGDEEDVVRATRTVTLGAMKPGLAVRGAQPFVGRVSVADLGLPEWLVERAKREQATA